MTGEREWVDELVKRLKLSPGWENYDIAPEQPLLYALEVEAYPATANKNLDYKNPKTGNKKHRIYRTDLLVSERGKGQAKEDLLIPRVIVEFKLGGVHTHDALTYSAKAATHKQVHPYIRYGIVIVGHRDGGLPVRLVRHGHQFDFMLVLKQRKPDEACISQLAKLLKQEAKASKQLWKLIQGGEFYQLHRKLVFKAKR